MNRLPPPRASIERIANFIDADRPDLAACEAEGLRREWPNAVEPLRLHAIALLRMDRAHEARDLLEHARRLAPESIDVACNLGSALLACEDADAALTAFEAARNLAPAHPAVWNGLGNARRAAGDFAGAREAYAEAVRLAPGHVGAALNLAAADLALGAVEDAERRAREVLDRTGGHPEAWLLLGHALAAQARPADALSAYASGGRAAPQDARFAYQMGLMAQELRDLPAAATAHARALALDPTMDAALGQLVFVKRQLCDWAGLDALSARLRARITDGAPGISPFAVLAEPFDAATQRQCATTCATAIERAAAPLRARLGFTHASRGADARLRIGFASNGFGNHPTGLLTVALFEALRGEDVQVELFATGGNGEGPIGDRLRAATQGWHVVVGLAPEAIARRLHAADLDVLVDLRGWGDGGIAEALALRPAPLQVNWLAYPGTSGAPWIDYVIADRFVLPAALRAQFSEAVAWLPRCFQPSDPTRVVAEPPPRAACGLPEAAPVFVCFNNSYKLNRATFARLAAVLRGVPDAVLWLLSGPADSDDRLRAAAQGDGIDPARLVFMPRLPHDEYLARFRHADVFLDTDPYNAHTTASDALWAGCPVLTTPGGTFAARVAGSLNHHLGMQRMNRGDDADFIDFAIRIGRDVALRAELRAELAERRRDSGLFDMNAFARDFATLLRRLVERQRTGLTPESIEDWARHAQDEVASPKD